jgi:glycosyltransferase involved in cell wall biosynthesis
MKNQFNVSILICAHNGAQYIETNLNHIAQQKNVAYEDLEVILIDNNSVDNTDQIARNIWQKLNNPFNFLIEYETKQGKPHALKKAIQFSNNNLLLVCDCDNYLDPNYVRNVIDTFKENPNIGFLQGTSIAYDDGITKLPSWVYQFRGMYVLHTTDHLKTGFIPDNQVFHIHGAGSIFQKKHVDLLFSFGFDFISVKCPYLSIDMSDKQLVIAFEIMGLKNYFSEKLLFTHDLRFDRITFEKHFKQIKNWGYRYSINHFYNCIIHLENPTLLNVIIGLYLKIPYLILSFLKINLKSELNSLMLNGQFSLLIKSEFHFRLYRLIGMFRTNWLFNNYKETRLWIHQAKNMPLKNDKNSNFNYEP